MAMLCSATITESLYELGGVAPVVAESDNVITSRLSEA